MTRVEFSIDSVPPATAIAIIWFNQRQPKSAVAELAWQIIHRTELCALGWGGMQNYKAPHPAFLMMMMWG